jgi:hypothetical protein
MMIHNRKKYHYYVERITPLADTLPTYEPTEYYTIKPTSSSQQTQPLNINTNANTLQYIITVSFATSILTSCCVICTIHCFSYIRNRLKQIYLRGLSESSSSQSTDKTFDLDDIYVELDIDP